jgi:PAS domain S-box-containing protein
MSVHNETGGTGDLKQRLQEAEETLVAIRKGEVDALVITGPHGEQVFTLKGADHPYRVLVEHMNEGALTVSVDGAILYSNGRFADIVRTPLENVIGRSLEEFVGEEHKASIRNFFESRCRGRSEAALRASDGADVPIAISCAGVVIDDSPCLCVIVSDLTDQKRQEALITDERRRAEERVRESERLAAVGKTAAVLAHEIGNPLNGMFTTVQLIERYLARSQSAVGDRHLRAPLQDLKGEISRLGALLHEFRSLSGPMQLNLRPLRLSAFLPELLQMTSHISDGSAVEIAHYIPHDLPAINADKEKLKQVFLNLCKNAVEAMPSGGTLTLRAYVKDQRLVIEVSDTGMGITQELDIFELFTTTKNKGTGLGLAVVRQIVSDHGGSITYTSEPGKGTTFYVSLPLAASN